MKFSSQQYLNLLKNHIVPTIRTSVVEQNIEFEEIVFQHDNASIHTTETVSQYLNDVFRLNWIGKGGPIKWPGRSDDLSPNNFFAALFEEVCVSSSTGKPKRL